MYTLSNVLSILQKEPYNRADETSPSSRERTSVARGPRSSRLSRDALYDESTSGRIQYGSHARRELRVRGRQILRTKSPLAIDLARRLTSSPLAADPARRRLSYPSTAATTHHLPHQRVPPCLGIPRRLPFWTVPKECGAQTTDTTSMCYLR